MKITKRFTLLLLSLIIVLPLLLTACNNEQTGDNDTSEVSASEDEEFKLATGLEPKNWSGKTVKFLTFNDDRGYYNREIASTQIRNDETLKNAYDGEQVYEAVVNRERAIEDNFGIKIEVEFSGSGETPSSIMEKQIKGGTNEYQVMCDSLLRTAQAGRNGHLYDLDLLGIDFSKDFWDQSGISDLSIDHKLFYVTGDAVVSDDQSTWCCFFNKDIIEEYHLDNPYELVRNNEWTIDKLYEMGKVYSAYNTSLQNVTWEDGHFGLVAQTYDGITSMCGMNEKIIAKDANDLPAVTFNDSEDLVTKFAKVYDLLKDENHTQIAEFIKDEDKYDKANSIFSDGRALFQYQKVQYVLDLASTNVNFGIIPMPKYSSDQEYYTTTCTVYWSLFLSVPKSLPEDEFELVGYAMQLMGYYGQKYLTPAYYDTTIKTQKVKDEESEEMLDLLFSHRIYDLASVYNDQHALYLYTNVICSSSNTLASNIAANADAIQGTIDEIIFAFDTN